MKQPTILLLTLIVTLTLYVLSFVTLGNGYPTIQSSGQEIIAWFSENGTCARTYAWLSTFVSLGLAVLGGLIATTMPRPHRYIFLAGMIGFAITAQIQAWFWAALALHPHELEFGTARVLFDIPTYWGPVVNASMVAMAAPVVALGFGEHPIIPRWLTAISLIFGIEQAIETITIFGRAGFIAPGGPMNVYLGGALGFLFLIGLTIWAMARMEGRAPTSEPHS